MSDEKPSPEGQKNKKKDQKTSRNPELEKEVGGFEAQGLQEPTRYNDWEVNGRCSDF